MNPLVPIDGPAPSCPDRLPEPSFLWVSLSLPHVVVITVFSRC